MRLESTHVSMGSIMGSKFMGRDSDKWFELGEAKDNLRMDLGKDAVHGSEGKKKVKQVKNSSGG